VPAVRQGADEGRPVVAVDPQSETAQALIAIAERLAALGPARVYRKELSLR
jgi:MinD-like ATPase involved in chromosome partitioning or flagellar assembly